MYQYQALQLDAQRFNTFLTKIAESLDIPDSSYEEATLKYEEVALWLSRDDSELAKYAPDIYPQGSFRLGTVVRPIVNKCGFAQNTNLFETLLELNISPAISHGCSPGNCEHRASTGWYSFDGYRTAPLAKEQSKRIQ
jgi:hypothetical protein